MTLTRARGRNEFELAAMHSINTLPPRDANSTLIRQTIELAARKMRELPGARARARATPSRVDLRSTT